MHSETATMLALFAKTYLAAKELPKTGTQVHYYLAKELQENDLGLYRAILHYSIPRSSSRFYNLPTQHMITMMNCITILQQITEQAMNIPFALHPINSISGQQSPFA